MLKFSVLGLNFHMLIPQYLHILCLHYAQKDSTHISHLIKTTLETINWAILPTQVHLLMLTALRGPLCSKQCWNNVLVLTWQGVGN